KSPRAAALQSPFFGCLTYKLSLTMKETPHGACRLSPTPWSALPYTTSIIAAQADVVDRPLFLRMHSATTAVALLLELSLPGSSFELSGVRSIIHFIFFFLCFYFGFIRKPKKQL